MNSSNGMPSDILIKTSLDKADIVLPSIVLILEVGTFALANHWERVLVSLSAAV